MSQPVRYPEGERPASLGTESDRTMIENYVIELQRRTQGYDMSVAEARRVVDESMGSVRLTDLLYESREDD